MIRPVHRLLAAAARGYVLRFPLAHGKGVVLRRLVQRLPIEDREIEVETFGGVVVLRWDEAVGRHVLRNGSFERREVEAMRALIGPGDTVFDVGANVGLITVPLALAVGAAGRVIAVEPLPENVARLKQNLRRNAIEQVDVVAAAAGGLDGEVLLNVAADSAFASLGTLTKYRGAGTLRVPCRRLDSLWRGLGGPPVALMKIDVEGGELAVLDGARELLETARPTLLIEADPGAAAAAVTARLSSAGYVRATPAGFARANHLFRPA